MDTKPEEMSYDLNQLLSPNEEALTSQGTEHPHQCCSHRRVEEKWSTKQGGESRLMLTGQKGKSKVVRDFEVAKAESQDPMTDKKAVASCPG